MRDRKDTMRNIKGSANYHQCAGARFMRNRAKVSLSNGDRLAVAVRTAVTREAGIPAVDWERCGMRVVAAGSPKLRFLAGREHRG